MTFSDKSSKKKSKYGFGHWNPHPIDVEFLVGARSCSSKEFEKEYEEAEK